MFNKKINKGAVLNSNILPQVNANLSTFDLSEGLTTTIKTDYLYPVYWQELIPNDHFEIDISSLARIMPMVAPPMSNIRMKFFAFFVPNRLLWDKWLNFMGERTYQKDMSQMPQLTIPQVSLKDNTNVTGGIADYLGVPPTEEKVDEKITALPLRAYNKIWNEWFRANMLQEEVVEYSGDGQKEIPDRPEKLSEYKLLKKGKPIDYFTSCLPEPLQVDISLAGNAPIVYSEVGGVVNVPLVKNLSSGSKSEFYMSHSVTIGGQPVVALADVVTRDAKGVDLYADMSKVTGISINALRKAAALQIFNEKDMRAGNTYIDLMHEHFGITVPDFLVGRSEYIGSTTTQINSEPILQQSETSVTPQGNIAAVGFGVEQEKLCEYSAREHGILMVLACVEADVTYQQGLDRKFSKRDRYDYYWPEFANLGEQPVMEKELFLDATTVGSNEKVFGYSPRYREYREGYSKVSGLMRSNVTSGNQSLDVWHLAQKFASAPKLNDEFIVSNTPLDRVLAVPDDDSILLNVWFDVKATRSIPVSANPSLLAGRV